MVESSQFTVDPESAAGLLKRIDPKFASSLEALLKAPKSDSERKTISNLITSSVAHLNKTLSVKATAKVPIPRAPRMKSTTAGDVATAAAGTAASQESGPQLDSEEAAPAKKTRAPRKSKDTTETAVSAKPSDEIPPGERFKL